MKLVVEGDNAEQRAEGARRAVGCIFGPNTAAGPLRMAPEFIRRLLVEDWPTDGLQITLRPALKAADFSKLMAVDATEQIYRIMLNRMEVYETEFRHIGSAVWMSREDLRTLAAWEKAQAGE